MISETDAVGKRILLFEALAFLLLPKLLQWYFHNWSWNLFGLYQWILIEAAILAFAYRKGVEFPRKFGLNTISAFFLIFGVLSTFNYLLAQSSGETLLTRVLQVNTTSPKLFKVTPSVVIPSVDDGPSHKHPFNGSLILHHRPYARLRIENNPVSVGANVPLAMRGASPWTLTYKISNWIGISDPFENTTLATMAVTGLPPYFLQCQQVGSYSLFAVHDHRGIEGKVGNETVRCVDGPMVYTRGIDQEPKPSASFHSSHLLRTCQGRNLTTVVKILGTRPFTLLLQREAHGRTTQLLLENLHYHENRYFRINLGILDTAGKYRWKILAVTDAFNLTSSYGTPDADHVEAPEMNVEVLPKPEAFLETSLIYIAENAWASIPISLRGHPPFSLVLSQPTPEGGYREATFRDIPASPFVLNATTQGVYRIRSFSDASCPGVIREPSTCQVTILPAPTVRMDPLPLASPCLGDSYLTINLEFTGRGPWSLRYSHVVSDPSSPSAPPRTIPGHVTSSSLQHPLRITPSLPGNHSITFLLLSDHLYPSVSLKGLSYSFLIHDKPRGTLEGPHGRICPGESGKFTLSLAGRPPFQLKYLLTSPPNHVSEHTLEVEKHVVEVDLPVGQGGRYGMELHHVVDANGCASSAPPQEKGIDVTQPSAHFICRGDRKSLRIRHDEKVQIELSGGIPPYHVTLHHSSSGRTEIIRNILQPRHLIHVAKNELLTLLSVNDSSCRGIIESPETCDVHLVQAPSLSLALFGRRDECVHEPIHVATFNLTGEGPWEVVYQETVTLPLLSLLSSGEISSKRKALTIHHPLSFSFNVTPALVGKTHLKLLELSDLRYDKISLEHLPPIELTVHAKPEVAYKENGKEYFLCRHGQLEVPFVAKGKGPFRLRYSLLGDSRDKDRERERERERERGKEREKEREPLFLDFTAQEGTLLLHFPSIGTHEVVLLEIEDAVCRNRILNQRILVHVGEPPRVASVQAKTDVCLNDRVSFRFSPSNDGPWNVTYSFSPFPSSSSSSSSPSSSSPPAWFISHDPEYLYVPEKAGIFNITAISNRFCASSSSSSSVLFHVHALPTGEMNHGRDVKESISEGEQVDIVLDLIGEPPFHVVLWKTHFFDDSTEVFEIPKIEGRHYTLPAHEEGEYFIASVADRFCKSFRDPNTKP